jgi:hypothetical protein
MRQNPSTVSLASVFTLWLVFVLGCGAGRLPPQRSENGNSQTRAAESSKTEPALSPSEEKITKQEFGDKWPFTVGEGVLSCRGANGTGQVLFTANSKTYAVNGLARGTKMYASADEIWADNPFGPGPKKDIGPVIERGLKLCR